MTSDASAALAGFAPLIAPDCRAVVLGSFPSVKSLSAGHYYAHPRNQFWAIMAQILGEPLTDWPFEQRYVALQSAGLGLWDVIEQCERQGSLDSDIRQARFSALTDLRQWAPGVSALLLNGRKAQAGARRFEWPGVQLFDLPSTSPAYAAMTRDQKQAQWQQALSQVPGLKLMSGQGACPH